MIDLRGVPTIWLKNQLCPSIRLDDQRRYIVYRSSILVGVQSSWLYGRRFQKFKVLSSEMDQAESRLIR
jgi:hypothetical protein